MMSADQVRDLVEAGAQIVHEKLHPMGHAMSCGSCRDIAERLVKFTLSQFEAMTAREGAGGDAQGGVPHL